MIKAVEALFFIQLTLLTLASFNLFQAVAAMFVEKDKEDVKYYAHYAFIWFLVSLAVGLLAYGLLEVINETK